MTPLKGAYNVGVHEEYTEDELEFMMAMDRYKRDNNRPFPTWHEVYKVFVSLGYSK